MKKNILIYALILSFSLGQFAVADVSQAESETINTVTTEKKKGFWFFSKKNKNDKNTKNISNEVTEEMKPENSSENLTKTEKIQPLDNEKKDVVNYVNNSLMSEYFSGEKNITTNDGIVEGIVQKDNTTNIENFTVEGYVQETFIFSLDDCIKKALQNNPQIRSAFSNSEIYKTKIGQAWANYFPTFSMTNGYTRNRFFTVNFGVPDKYYHLYNAATINASMLLFDFGKTKAIADMSKRTYESTLSNLEETINTIVYSVKEAYYSTLHALEKQKVYADSVASYELQLKQAEAFYSIGTKPKIDVTMAQYNLGNAQLGYIKATNEVSLALAQLNNAMGLPEEDNYKIVDQLNLQEYDFDFDDILKKSLDTRPEIIAYRKKAKASEMLLRSAKRAFLPNIEAVGSYQVGGATSYSDGYGWTYGAQFVYGNTNLWLLKKQVEEAKATHRKDLADLDVAEQNVYLQVKQAYVNVKNATESIPVTALSLKHAKEQFDLATGRYKAGVGNAIELKDSEITYRNARLDYLSALLQYNVSIADLERVAGFKLKPLCNENIN